jgi:hypothetical protein
LARRLLLPDALLFPFPLPFPFPLLLLLWACVVCGLRVLLVPFLLADALLLLLLLLLPGFVRSGTSTRCRKSCHSHDFLLLQSRDTQLRGPPLL